MKEEPKQEEPGGTLERRRDSVLNPLARINLLLDEMANRIRGDRLAEAEVQHSWQGHRVEGVAREDEGLRGVGGGVAECLRCFVEGDEHGGAIYGLGFFVLADVGGGEEGEGVGRVGGQEGGWRELVSISLCELVG